MECEGDGGIGFILFFSGYTPFETFIATVSTLKATLNFYSVSNCHIVQPKCAKLLFVNYTQWKWKSLSCVQHFVTPWVEERNETLELLFLLKYPFCLFLDVYQLHLVLLKIKFLVTYFLSLFDMF